MGDTKGNSIPWYLPEPGAGRLHVITGPMFAKKTTMLLTRLADLREEGYRTLYINHVKDSVRCASGERYSTHNTNARFSVRVTPWLDASQSVGTRDGIHTEDGVKKDGIEIDRSIHGAMCGARLSEIEEMCDSYDVVGIDEGQFFDDLHAFCRRQAQRRYVIVAGLDSDFCMEPFGHVSALVAISESFVKVSAVCRACRAEAPPNGNPCHAHFTRRIAPARPLGVSGGDTKRDDVVDIGGREKYEAVCRRHHHGHRDTV